MKDLRTRKESSLTVDIAGTVAAAAQLGMFSPAALSIASPACTLPTPSHYMLSPENFRAEAATSRHNAAMRLQFPPMDETSPQASPEVVQLLGMAQAPSPVDILQGQQMKHHQQREEMLMRQQLEHSDVFSMQQQQDQQQRQIQQMQQDVFNRGVALQQMADQVEAQSSPQQHEQLQQVQFQLQQIQPQLMQQQQIRQIQQSNAQVQQQLLQQRQQQIQQLHQTNAQQLIQQQQQQQTSAQMQQQLVQQAQTQAQVHQAHANVSRQQPHMSPLGPYERRLLAALESRLLDPDYNKFEGSLSMVKLQGYLKTEHEESNREVVDKKYKGSFHKFIKTHERKFTYFYYTAAEIEENELAHCDEHEGRLRFEDVSRELCLARDRETARWRMELMEAAIAEAEEIVRSEQLQVRGLMNAFRERTGRRFLAVADSNHALRNLVKGCERFMLTQENMVKLRSEASEEELSVWLKRLESEKAEKVKAPAAASAAGKGKGKKRAGNGRAGSSPSPSVGAYTALGSSPCKSPATASIGSASPPQVPMQLSSPGYPYNLLCDVSSSSATSTPASVPSAFQVYHPQAGAQFLGSPPGVVAPFQQPPLDGFRPHDFHIHNMPFQQYHPEQFAQA